MMNVLNELKKVNEKQSIEGFKTKLSDWSLSQWSNAIAGETGELCNIVKKVERGDFHKRPENASDNPEYNNAYAAAQYREKIGKEAADIVLFILTYYAQERESIYVLKLSRNSMRFRIG